MSEAVVDDIVAVLPPLLQSLEALGFIARHLNPPDYLSKTEPAPEPEAVEPAEPPEGEPERLDPTRYGDWEKKGIAVDF